MNENLMKSYEKNAKEIPEKFDDYLELDNPEENSISFLSKQEYEENKKKFKMYFNSETNYKKSLWNWLNGGAINVNENEYTTEEYEYLMNRKNANLELLKHMENTNINKSIETENLKLTSGRIKNNYSITKYFNKDMEGSDFKKSLIGNENIIFSLNLPLTYLVTQKSTHRIIGCVGLDFGGYSYFLKEYRNDLLEKEAVEALRKELKNGNLKMMVETEWNDILKVKALTE